MTEMVLFSELATNKSQKIGVITLNAEKSLNALNQSMVDQLFDQLQIWQSDNDIVCVFMQGSGEKAFCAGGDVRALRQATIDGDPDAGRRFFEKEYRVDYLIHTYPKPIICWGNGIVMGGGIGLMSGAHFRVVTDTSMLAMPEISIGLYPDVGGSWELGRMPGNIGLFMALTGCRLNSADAMYLGMANRFIDHAFRNNVLESLQQADWESSDSYTTVFDVVQHYADSSAGWLPYSKIREHRDQINKLMDQSSLSSVMKAIESLETGDDWLQRAQKTALAGSSFSAAIGYEQLKRSKHMSLKEVFLSELIVSSNCISRGDFKEGVRSLLVDKDRNPQWQFKSVNDVDRESLERMFVPPWGEQEHPLSDI